MRGGEVSVRILPWVIAGLLIGSSIYAQSVTTVQVQAYMQGFWNGTTHVPVPIAIELRSGSQLQTSTLVARQAAMLSTTGSATATFDNLTSGNYWIVIRCGGHLPVASSSAVLVNAGSTVSWDFRSPANVFNGTFALIQVGSSYALRSGDVTNDQGVNVSDLLGILGSNGLSNPGQVPQP